MQRRIFIRIALGTAVFMGASAGGIGAFLHTEAFGAVPEPGGAIAASPHFADGVFHNTLPTPVLTDKSSFAGSLVRGLFAKKDRPVPPAPVPVTRAGLAAAAMGMDCIVWFGHSSFLVQAGGHRFLIDPVFSAYASPVSFSVRAFPGTTVFSAADMPRVDALLISHDHWDHLDHPTVMALRRRVGSVICPLGVGAHFRRWGFDATRIHEVDWGGVVDLGDARVHVAEARHFSGRSLDRNRTLWGGFVIEAGGRRVFYSGDGGYGPHFAALGRTFGRMDAVLLDCGQYNERWKYIHMNPEEAARAADDLRAGLLVPAHVGRFALAHHPWDEPFQRVSAAARSRGWQLATPMIGQAVPLSGPQPAYQPWWEDLARQGQTA